MDTREVRIGNRVIGGGNPVLIQSMTNTKDGGVQATRGTGQTSDCSGL